MCNMLGCRPFCLSLVSLLLGPGLFALDATPPMARIPLAPEPVDLAAGWQPAAWAPAARLRNIYDLGGKELSTPETTFYVMYDLQALLVAVVCREPITGYPSAVLRGPLDLGIVSDDAVQVVLGVADANVLVREVLNMGGYEGALGGQVTAADHYYQFILNAAGSCVRTYNETPLPRALFQGRVERVEHGWVALLRIPFASCGLTVKPGQTIYANLFRFRPPKMTGWYLPAFGGYAAMPLGTFMLLPAGQKTARTMETPPAPAKDVPVANSAPAAWDGTINAYSLSGAVVGTVVPPPGAAGGVATLKMAGLGEKTLPLANASGKQVVIFDLPPGSQPARTAELTVTDTRGKTLFHTTQAFPAVTAPAWLGTTAGKEYLDQKIPAPWTRPVVDGLQVRLVDKTLRFGPFGLPESVRDGLGELLAGPAQIVVETNGRAVVFTPGPVSVAPAGLGAVVSASAKAGGLVLESRCEVDYDGFMVVKVRLDGVPPATISRLAVRLPLQSAHAKFHHQTLVQDIGSLQGGRVELPAGPLWVGDEDKGLAFSFDLNPFLSVNQRRQVRAVREDGATWLEVNLVDGPNQITDAGHIFRFFLQPTPTKPVSLKKVHPTVQWQWEQWSDWQGYPDLKKLPALKQWSDDLHRKGQIGLLYTCQGLAEDAPEFTKYQDDLMGQPFWVFYRRAYNPGLNVPCHYTCKRGPEGDLQLWAFAKLVKKGGIDGTVSDGLSLAWECAHPGHRNGCGRPLVMTWERDPVTAVTGQRQFLKRLRGIFNDSGRPFYLAAHCGGGLQVNTLSFFDGYMEGEQLARFRTGYQIPLPTMAVGYSGRPWGFRTIFWEKTWRRLRGFNWSLTYALLHDVELEDSMLANQIYAPFEDDRETQYYPYWRPGSHVRLEAGKALVSYYRKSDEALVVVGNLSYEPDTFKLNVSGLLPGVPLQAVDLIGGKPYPVVAGCIDGTLEPYRCLALRVTRAAAAPVPAVAAAPATAAASSVPAEAVAGQGGVGTRGTDWDCRDGANAGAGELILASVANHPPAAATLKRYSLGRNGTVALKVKMTGRFQLKIGPVTLLHDGNWQMPGPLDGWSVGTVYQVAPKPAAFSTLVVTVRDGHFDAVLDGAVLVSDMSYDLPAAGNGITVLAWAGDTVTFRVLEISAAGRPLFTPALSHPVL